MEGVEITDDVGIGWLPCLPRLKRSVGARLLKPGLE